MIDPFYGSLDATMAAKQAFVGGLADWVPKWMGWMRFAFLGSFWFLWAHVEARWVLATSVATQIVATGLAYFIGWGPLWGGVHILLWGPLLVYLYRRRAGLISVAPYAVWSNVLMATIAVSLLFDTRDVGGYLWSLI